MQRIVNESDYCKKWNLREARKLTMVFFFKKKCQRTGVLNYKRMFRHLLEIYTLYVTIETFICFSTYSTWVVFVISRLLLLCVTFFHLFYTQKIQVKTENQNIEWWSGISFFHIWFVIIRTIVSGDKSQKKWKMICLSPAYSFNGGCWVRLLNLAPVTWLGSCCNMA